MGTPTNKLTASTFTMMDRSAYFINRIGINNYSFCLVKIFC